MLPYQNSLQDGRAPRIAIVGLGGAGANILHCFSGQTNAGITLCTMALDERVGRHSGVGSFLQLGKESNHGFGSGGDPDVGASAAEESEERVREMLNGLDLLVLVTGLGGGTGSGAAPVIARLAREAGVFLVAVATLPFSFEGVRRREQAERALAQLSIAANVLLCFENDHMEELLPPGKGAHDAFAEADQLLAKATAAVPMLATSPGLINLGLDELKQVLRSRNARCVFGSGTARGVDRARRAAERALESPLLAYRQAAARAGAVLVHIAGGESLSLEEIRVAMDAVGARVNPEAELFFGTAVKPRLGDELRVTLISSVDPEDLVAPVKEPQADPVPVEPAGPETPHEETGDMANGAAFKEGAVEESLPEETGPQQQSSTEEASLNGVMDEADAGDRLEAIVEEEQVIPAPAEEPAAESQESVIAETAAEFLPEPEPVHREKPEPVVPAKRQPRAKAEGSVSGAKTRWIQSSFLPEDVQVLPEDDAREVEPASQAAFESARGGQYEFDLEAEGGEMPSGELDNEDLDVPPALRSDNWNNMFPEE